jgi:hypothetical protein
MSLEEKINLIPNSESKDDLNGESNDGLNDESNDGLNDESNDESNDGLNDESNDGLNDGLNDGSNDGLNDGLNDGSNDEDNNSQMGGMAGVLRDISSGSNLRRLSPGVSEEIKELAPNQKVADLEAENRRLTHLNTSLHTLTDELYVKKETIIIELTTLKGVNNQLMLDNEKKDNKLSLLRTDLKDRISEIEYKRKHIESLTIDNESLSTKYDDIKRNYETGKNGIDMRMIESKCEVYYNLFIRLYDKLTITKKRLDLYQTYLKRINSVIQLSVITLSIGSSFIQALNSTNYEIFFSADTIINSTEYTNYETELDESTYSSIVGIVTLSVSTYSALVIAAERHFSFQQRETNVEKLKESYAEPINRIRSNLELIKPWRYKSYYMKTKEETIINENETSEKINVLCIDDTKKNKWNSMVDKLDSEYVHIVDVKKELDTTLDKIISIKTIKSYQKNVPRKKRETDLITINNMELHANNNKFMYNWWINCFLNCFKCSWKQVNHAYDEEDLNHLEDREEIKGLNKLHSKV